MNCCNFHFKRKIMQKSWYVLYTKPDCEERVLGVLTKRLMECFYPVNYKKVSARRKSKTVIEPLFNSFVFVRASKDQIELLGRIENVINLVYWKNEPVVVTEGEIELLKELNSFRSQVQVEKLKRGTNSNSNSDPFSPQIVSSQRTLLVKSRIVKIEIPSLGVGLTLQVNNDTLFTRGVLFANHELSAQ